MIQHLKNLGLTEIESRCYIALVEKPNQTGYEVAKNLGISRSNVYASLKSLEDKGGCVSFEDTSTTYSAVSINEFLNILRMDFKRSSRYLRHELAKVASAPFELRTIQGKDKVLRTLTRLLSQAKTKVVLTCSKQDLEILNPLLEELEVQLETALADYILVIIDDEVVFMGSLDEKGVSSGFVVRHPLMVKHFIESHLNQRMIENLIEEKGSAFLDPYK